MYLILSKGNFIVSDAVVCTQEFPFKLNVFSNLFKNIHSRTLCGGKKLENEGPFNWGMAEQIVVYAGDGILLCSKE